MNFQGKVDIKGNITAKLDIYDIIYDIFLNHKYINQDKKKGILLTLIDIVKDSALKNDFEISIKKRQLKYTHKSLYGVLWVYIIYRRTDTVNKSSICF